MATAMAKGSVRLRGTAVATSGFPPHVGGRWVAAGGRAALGSSRARQPRGGARRQGALVRASSIDTEVEVQGLAQLKETLADTKATERDMRWFLRDRKFDAEAADAKIRKMLAWRADFGADDLTEESVASEAATRKAFLHTSRDKFGRPVIVVTATKHLAGDEGSLKRVCELATFILDGAVEQLQDQDASPWDVDSKGKPVPHVEQTVLCIFDLRGFTNKNGDLGFAKFMVDVFFNLYPKRLSECLFIDPPLVFRPGWAIIKPWLGSYSKLVRFISAQEVVNEYFTPETVPEELK